MFKAGLIGAVTGFIYITSLTLLSPFCTLCFTPLLGLGVGYLTGWFDKPLKQESSLSRGGIAGGITGIGAVVGQMLATVVNGILVTNWEQLPDLMRELGFVQFPIPDANQYWQTTLTANSFCSVLNLTIISGLGAVGGIIWFQRQNKNSFSTLPS